MERPNSQNHTLMVSRAAENYTALCEAGTASKFPLCSQMPGKGGGKEENKKLEFE